MNDTSLPASVADIAVLPLVLGIRPGLVGVLVEHELEAGHGEECQQPQMISLLSSPWSLLTLVLAVSNCRGTVLSPTVRSPIQLKPSP